MTTLMVLLDGFQPRLRGRLPGDWTQNMRALENRGPNFMSVEALRWRCSWKRRIYRYQTDGPAIMASCPLLISPWMSGIADGSACTSARVSNPNSRACLGSCTGSI